MANKCKYCCLHWGIISTQDKQVCKMNTNSELFIFLIFLSSLEMQETKTARECK